MILPPLVLASASPRRKKILEDSGLNFSIEVSSVDERDDAIHPWDLVLHNAEIKGRDVAQRNAHAIVIAADTLVHCRGEVLGKPASQKDALRMMNSYLGETLEIYTGLAVFYQDRCHSHVDKSLIHVDQRWAALTERFVELFYSLDKAGGFSIEGIGAVIFDNIEGSFYNILGLPLHLLYVLFEKHNLDLLDFCRGELP